MSSTNASVSSTASVGNHKRLSHGRAKNFHHRYAALCRAGNFKPIPEIVNPKQKGIVDLTLDVYGDRFTVNDWRLIAKALQEDRSLQRLAIRLRKAYTEVFDGPGQQKVDGNQPKNRPEILEKRLLKSLIESLANLLSNNQKLEVFILEGLPLAGIWTSILSARLKDNSSLTELNLARCSIGDEGCEILCRELKNRPNLLTLNLSACQLTARACQALANAIKFQKIQRYDMSWELSLRYGEIREEKLFGLKHIYLSHNPAIGDEGLLELTEVLKDDAWVRQVHMRNCGLTDACAQMLLECLNLNATIEKFDVGENIDISNATCQEILIKLDAPNIAGDDGPESEPVRAKNSTKTIASLREYNEVLETQLQSELQRYSQLESTVAQLHLRLGDYAMQISQLQRDNTLLTDEKNELLESLKKLQKHENSKVLATGTPRKIQSESHAPGSVFKAAASSMSESAVPRGASRSYTSPAKTRFLDRSIGDSGAVVRAKSDTPQQAAKHLEAEGDGAALVGWETDELVEHTEKYLESSKDLEADPQFRCVKSHHSVLDVWRTISNLESDELPEEDEEN
ncbi:protein Cep78 homolog [Anopheles ziemanni]|uniref:protein Cep78 homolog n=1 Tax=Anopheles coustani TaxID=139045 RepID=UPI002659030F|nr:protein Cep78 homolog [Anopheles coustani]XP_058170171.1 protein Cep78 homolog [Anopheles ziemanni]